MGNPCVRCLSSLLCTQNLQVFELGPHRVTTTPTWPVRERRWRVMSQFLLPSQATYCWQQHQQYLICLFPAYMTLKHWFDCSVVKRPVLLVLLEHGLKADWAPQRQETEGQLPFHSLRSGALSAGENGMFWTCAEMHLIGSLEIKRGSTVEFMLHSNSVTFEKTCGSQILFWDFAVPLYEPV